MVVFTINGNSPDASGNITIGNTSIVGDNRPVKMWFGSVTTSSGAFSVDYTAAGFTSVRTIQVTLQHPTAVDADYPLSASITNFSTTTANGKAFRATSAGALVAMQQTAAVAGTTAHVMVIGH